MATLSPDSDEAKRIDAALQGWRQGDLALDESWFVHVGDPGAPLTVAAAEAADGDLQALTSEVRGMIVVTQTCDITRAFTSLHFLRLVGSAMIVWCRLGR